MTNKQKENLTALVKRRNHLLEQLFSDCNINVRLIGNPHKPMIVMEEIAFLSAYVSNFNLYFMCCPDGKVVIAKIKLRKEHGMNGDKLMDIIRKAPHRATMKICQKDIQLCLVGYGYRDSENNAGRYPVFGRYNHKVFFNQQVVEDSCATLNDESYDVRVLIPAKGNKHQLNIQLNGKQV